VFGGRFFIFMVILGFTPARGFCQVLLKFDGILVDFVVLVLNYGIFFKFPLEFSLEPFLQTYLLILFSRQYL